MNVLAQAPADGSSTSSTEVVFLHTLVPGNLAIVRTPFCRSLPLFPTTSGLHADCYHADMQCIALRHGKLPLQQGKLQCIMVQGM